jgi:hypothetical protein
MCEKLPINLQWASRMKPAVRPFYAIQQPRQMARILALTKASPLLISISLPMSVVGTCDSDRPGKITGKTNLSPSSSISEGGTGNG